METTAVVCANCRHIIQGGENVCEVCGSPIGVAVPPPMERFLTGDFHHQAVDRPTKLVVVFGVWFMFLPSAAVLAYYAITLLLNGSFVTAPMMAGFSLLFIAVVIKTTKNYINNRKVESFTEADF